MSYKITPLLMFNGNAEAAMEFYVSIFENSKIEGIVKYTAAGIGPGGRVKKAIIFLNGQQFICADSVDENERAFPNLSIYVEFKSKEDLENKYKRLSEGGKIIKPLKMHFPDNQYGQVQDKFGLSWQLNFSGKYEDSKDLNLCFATNQEVRPEYKF